MESRYLKRRGRRWYFQIAVPAEAQKHIGKKVLVEALHTDDLREAQQLRWARLAAAHARFDAAGAAASLSDGVIEREAQATLSRLLLEAEMAASRGEPLHWPAPEAAASGVWPEGTTEGEGLAFAAETFADAMATRRYDLVEVEAAAVVISLDLDQDPDDKALSKLCQSQLAAHHAAIRARIAALQGAPYDARAMLSETLQGMDGGGPGGASARPPEGRVAATTGNGAGELTISAATSACLAAHGIGARSTGRGEATDATVWSAATHRQYSTTLRLFADCMFDRALNDVTGGDTAFFIDAVSRLDPQWHRAPGALGLSFEALVHNHTRAPGLSRKTIDRHVAAGSALFTWAVATHNYSGSNPFDGLYGAAGGTPTQPTAELSGGEIRALIDAAGENTAGAPDSLATALRWAVHLALFGGLRQREICQLRPQDVVETDGVWAVYAGAAPRRRGRLVPLHPHVLAGGFLDHWGKVTQQGAALLFPGLTDHRPGQGAARLSRALAQLNRSARLQRTAGFRALRASARGALWRAGVTDRTVAMLLEHQRAPRRRNEAPPATADLAAAIAGMDFGTAHSAI